MTGNVLTPEQIKLIRDGESMIKLVLGGVLTDNIPVNKLVNLESTDHIDGFINQYINDNFDDYCIDNHRFAKICDKDKLNTYYDIKYNGCCVHFDVVILVNNEAYVIGANYGH